VFQYIQEACEEDTPRYTTVPVSGVWTELRGGQ